MFESTEKLGLVVTYTGSEATPDNRDRYFSFIAEIFADGYSGTSRIDVADRDVERFADSLDMFYKSLSGEPELATGWGTEIHFRLRLQKYDSAGKVWMECMTRRPFGGNRFDECCINQFIEISQVSEMARFFKAALEYQSIDPLIVPPR